MSNIPLDKSVYAFEIDDVLFPRREYILQVYYLFSNFIEYTEGNLLAKDVLAFMKDAYERDGEQKVVEETIANFALAPAYQENYERLCANAHLPLKLFLKPEAKSLLTNLFGQGKSVAILTDGNPVEQLNKLKHIDWEDLAVHLGSLKVYFNDELNFRNIIPLSFLAEEYGVDESDIYPVTKL